MDTVYKILIGLIVTSFLLYIAIYAVVTVATFLIILLVIGGACVVGFIILWLYVWGKYYLDKFKRYAHSRYRRNG